MQINMPKCELFISRDHIHPVKQSHSYIRFITPEMALAIRPGDHVEVLLVTKQGKYEMSCRVTGKRFSTINNTITVFAESAFLTRINKK